MSTERTAAKDAQYAREGLLAEVWEQITEARDDDTYRAEMLSGTNMTLGDNAMQKLRAWIRAEMAYTEARKNL